MNLDTRKPHLDTEKGHLDKLGHWILSKFLVNKINRIGSISGCLDTEREEHIGV